MFPALALYDRAGACLAWAPVPEGEAPGSAAVVAFGLISFRPCRVRVVDASGERVPDPFAVGVVRRAIEGGADPWAVVLCGSGAADARYERQDLPMPKLYTVQFFREKLEPMLADLTRPVFAAELCLDFLNIPDTDSNIRQCAYVLSEAKWVAGPRRGSGFRPPAWWPPGTPPAAYYRNHPAAWLGPGGKPTHPFFAKHPEKLQGEAPAKEEPPPAPTSGPRRRSRR